MIFTIFSSFQVARRKPRGGTNTPRTASRTAMPQGDTTPRSSALVTRIPYFAVGRSIIGNAVWILHMMSAIVTHLKRLATINQAAALISSKLNNWTHEDVDVIFSSALCHCTAELLSSRWRPSSIVRPSVKPDFSEPVKKINAKFGGKVSFHLISRPFLLFFKILHF